MGRKKFAAMDSKKDVTPKESSGRIFMVISSRWFFILILLLAGIVWYGFYATHTKEVGDSDDREYASIARNIVNGKGIVRNSIYPADINFFKKLPIPEFIHPPGYPLIIAGFFKLFGISDFVALLPSYLSYFVLLILLFYFAKRYLGIKPAIIAAVIFIFNKEILDYSVTALSEGTYTLFFFLFFTVFVTANSVQMIFIAGLLLGISHLIRQNIYAFLVPPLVYLYFYPNLSRWRKMIFLIIGVLIPIIPNIVRAYLETGSPFFSYGKFALMAYTQKYPWLHIYRDIQNPSLSEFLINEPGQFIFKYLDNLISAVGQILSFSNPFLLAFFMIEMFHWKINPEWKRIKILFLFLLISQILFTSLHTFVDRYFIPFLPIMILFASQSFLRLSEDLVSRARALWRERIFFLTIFLFLVFFMIPSISTIFLFYKFPMLDFKTPQPGYLIPRREAEALNKFLKNELRGDQIIWTDFAEIPEWEGDRLCGWLPTRIETIHEIHPKVPVNAILLTNVRTLYFYDEWKYLLLSGKQSLPRYRNVKLYRSRSGAVFAKLLIRDEAE